MVADTENHALLASQSPFVGHPVSSAPPEPSDEPRMSPFVAIILLYGIMLLIVGAQVCHSICSMHKHDAGRVHRGGQLLPATLVGWASPPEKPSASGSQALRAWVHFNIVYAHVCGTCTRTATHLLLLYSSKRMLYHGPLHTARRLLVLPVCHHNLACLCTPQTALFMWKKRHRKSYELVTLLGLWLMPAIISLHLRFWRFLLIWALYSSIAGRLLFACTRKKIARTAPREVRCPVQASRPGGMKLEPFQGQHANHQPPCVPLRQLIIHLPFPSGMHAPTAQSPARTLPPV